MNEIKFTDAEMQALDAEVKSNLGKVDEAALHILVQCQSALYWGGNWSLIAETDNNYKTIAGVYPAIKEKYASTVKIAKIKGGIIMQADERLLLTILNTLAPTFAKAHEAEFMERVTKTRSSEGERFAKFWQKTQKGNTDMFKAKDSKGNNRLSGTLGAYCTNVNPTITINGIAYPAFKLSPFQIFDIMGHNTADPSKLCICMHSGEKSQWVPVASVNPAQLLSALSFPYDTAGHAISRPSALVMRFALR